MTRRSDIAEEHTADEVGSGYSGASIKCPIKVQWKALVGISANQAQLEATQHPFRKLVGVEGQCVLKFLGE